MASDCKYSGAKSAPLGHASVCPMIENDRKYSTSRSGSKIGPSNESDRSSSALVPSLNETSKYRGNPHSHGIFLARLGEKDVGQILQLLGNILGEQTSETRNGVQEQQR